MDKNEKGIILILLLVSILLAFWILQFTISYNNLYKAYTDEYNEKEYCRIYNGINYKDRVLADGLYWENTDYYCVWAKNRTLDEQEEIERHEHCHYLVDNNYEHFCLSNENLINKSKEIYKIKGIEYDTN
ncbi:hypothetical protein EOM09_06480 [bacterium]|nr:hypothetical protein [bacterium]